MAKEQINVTGFSANMGEPTASPLRLVVEDKPPEKPPWYKRVKDRNLKAAKLLLKGLGWLGQIGSAIRGLEKFWELLNQKREPAEARQPSDRQA